MGWYKDINAILEQEPESWLAYLFGQQLDNMPHLKRRKPRLRGFALRLMKLGVVLLRDVRIIPRFTRGRSAKFMFVAGTLNQMAALDSTIDSLKSGGESVIAIANQKLINNADYQNRYIPLTFELRDVFRAFILLTRRGPALRTELMETDPIKVDWYFDSFCSVYIYLLYFYRILGELRPDFVVTANDHNPLNRSMLAVAHHLKIRTVYLQHASVSNLFPALQVNYAFLDGESALNTYRECEPNKSNTKPQLPISRILLTGQKKHLVSSERHMPATVGVAVNALDNVTSAITFIKTLAKSGLNVRVRWHPGQGEREANQYRLALADHSMVTMSNPLTEPVNEFMAKVRWLIAGNSSIHLEAALSGVVPIYFELTLPDNPDYYGFVKHGLAKQATSIDEVIQLVERPVLHLGTDVKAVRYYSATYRTRWHGREGDLVAECLSRISRGKQPPVEILSIR